MSATLLLRPNVQENFSQNYPGSTIVYQFVSGFLFLDHSMTFFEPCRRGQAQRNVKKFPNTIHGSTVEDLSKSSKRKNRFFGDQSLSVMH